MDSRRDFLKKAALLAAGSASGGLFPASIQRAFAIDPPPGSTYLDAEHVVILMQENRSFDHAFGRLRGVRGFNDPRAIQLPDGNPVWLQSNKQGETYAPFRLDLRGSKATWMSSLPHSWGDQTAARNAGHHDGWLDAKRSGNTAYAQLPLTLGFYDREDLPFYYAMADAFTICDQNFCSSLTGTTPNRLYLWSGTIRAEPSMQAKACVWNSDVSYGAEAGWKTFPDRLEAAGIPWCVYQNELSLPTGFKDEEEAWLANFTDNPLEWFSQYHVRFHESFRRHLPLMEATTEATLKQLEANASPNDQERKKLTRLKGELQQIRAWREQYTEERFRQLPPHEQHLHRKAFTTNHGDPDYRQLTSLTYHDGAQERTMQAPNGDVLHQFRQDVQSGRLPKVSWIVAPERFSDHPGSPWYGAWFISETLDILTKNPEVWKKTILVLCYDENDGYFDHVPPFVPPAPNVAGVGKASAGIDTAVEHVPTSPDRPPLPIGLGFRVPLLIASPWSRGGYVSSQIFDHTSILQLLEIWLSHKTGQAIRETNISDWRRTVCGDLSSVFRPFHGEKIPLPQPVERTSFLGSIHQAQFRPLPSGFKRLNPEELAAARSRRRPLRDLVEQEPGTRPACPLPYELTVDARLNPERKALRVSFGADNQFFGKRAAGAPFRVAAGKPSRNAAAKLEKHRVWDYTVKAGDRLTDDFALADFPDGKYHLTINGPNGFHREFQGSADDPALELHLEPTSRKNPAGTTLHLTNHHADRSLSVTITDLAYGTAAQTVTLKPGETRTAAFDLAASHGWYDWQIRVKEAPHYQQLYAGHIETGKESTSDPQMA